VSFIVPVFVHDLTRSIDKLGLLCVFFLVTLISVKDIVVFVPNSKFYLCSAGVICYESHPFFELLLMMSLWMFPLLVPALVIVVAFYR